jgi:dihydroorotate dehydrogenase
MYSVLRRLLFRLDAESAHALTLRLLRLAGALAPVRAALKRAYGFTDESLSLNVFGLDFPNPVGLAAGYDKDGAALAGLACLGFGHVELGTVTPRPQEGNPRPRVFRLVEDEALINRMGFPNAGAEALWRRLSRSRPAGVRVGVNIGKGAATPLERAADDYVETARRFYGVCDYLAVNVSSPNTLGLRRLQARNHLEALLRSLTEERRRHEGGGRLTPILVKLAPDLGDEELEDAVGAIQGSGVEGVILTNTTLERGGLTSARAVEGGGLSGRPLRARSTEVIRRVTALSGGRLPVVGVGGVFSAADVREKLDAGAVLVQVYTGLVYEGPGMVRRLLAGLSRGEGKTG